MSDYLIAAKLLGGTFLSAEFKIKVWQLFLPLLMTGAAMFLLGWMVFGWLLFPVEWQPNKLNNSPFATKVVYVYLVSEWYAYSGNNEKVQTYINQLDNADEVACYLADIETDLATKARLVKVAYLKNGQGCTAQNIP